MNPNKTSNIIIALIFIILNLGIFSYMMIEEPWDDESMYISAGVLIQQHSLYQDFPFLQMPDLPLFYGLIFHITGTSHYFLTAELINFFFMVISGWLLFLITSRITKNTLFALDMLLLFLFNDITIFTMKYSANTIIPLAFSLLGIYLFLFGLSSNTSRWVGILFSGMAIAVSIGTKLYYAATLPPFLILTLLYPKTLVFKQRIFKTMIPFSIGLIIGLIPVCYYLLRDIEIFMFNNLGYHQLNTIYREVTGYTHTMSSAAKLNFGLRLLKSPANIALIIGTLFLILIQFGDRQLKTRLFRLPKMEHLFCFFLFLLAVIAAFVPTPLWFHYFMLPFPYILILIAFWYRDLNKLNKKFMNILMACLVLVSFCGSGAPLFKDIGLLARPNKWSCSEIHRVAQQIKNSIGTVDQNQKIATLEPVYALEAGLPIYKELASGTFIFRLGNLLPERIVQKYSYVSSQNIGDLFEEDRPGAILVDLFGKGDLNKPLIEYAEQKNYKKIQQDFDGMILYVNPTLDKVKPKE